MRDPGPTTSGAGSPALPSLATLGAMITNVLIETEGARCLRLGAVTFLLPVPFVIGYGIGFAVGAACNRPGDLTGPETRR